MQVAGWTYPVYPRTCLKTQVDTKCLFNSCAKFLSTLPVNCAFLTFPRLNSLSVIYTIRQFHVPTAVSHYFFLIQKYEVWHFSVKQTFVRFEFVAVDLAVGWCRTKCSPAALHSAVSVLRWPSLSQLHIIRSPRCYSCQHGSNCDTFLRTLLSGKIKLFFIF